jgi:vancomycin resistance protein VanK
VTTAARIAVVPVSVRPLSTDEHLAYLRSLPSASFLQTPAWGQVKAEWAHESVGLFVGDAQVGVALVLYRRLPRLSRSLAYLPEGPVLDWESASLPQLLDALVAHLRSRGAFGIRMGPPVITRVWEAATVKAGLADPALHRLGEVPPDEVSDTGRRLAALLREGGWRLQGGDEGFAAGQPRYNFWLPLAGRSEADVLAGMNQQWRRNIKKAAKAGVEVRTGERIDLAAFHRIYMETAGRDRFTPRPLAYFETMYDALNTEEPGRMRLYLAQHEGDLVAATTLVSVGEHAWYSYGASTTAKREVRGSNAVQWQMIRDALASGASVYDLRGITDTLDDSDAHVGLVQFKAGTGGRAVEYAGEWDLPLSRPLYKAFELYLKYR